MHMLMRRYSLLTLLALLVSWAAGLGTHALLSLLLYGSTDGGDTQPMAFWSAFFLLIAWGLFIQLPEKQLSKLYSTTTLARFVLFTTLYALFCFSLLIGWIFLWHRSFLIVYLDAAMIGCVFGLSLRGLAKWSEKHYRRRSCIS